MGLRQRATDDSRPKGGSPVEPRRVLTGGEVGRDGLDRAALL
jgi:hypothetical protein